MDTSTLAPPREAAHRPADALHTAHEAPREAPHDAPPVTAGRSAPRTGLAAEVRESLMLLGFAVGVTVGLTTAAQAALALLG